jgi:hypothetical protein
MTGGTKILLGVVVGLVAGGTVVAIAQAANKPAPPPTPSPGPPATPAAPTPTGAVWLPATTIAPGAHVRASVAASDFAQLASSLGLTLDLVGWTDLLAQPQVAGALHTAAMNAWAPGPAGTMLPSALPADWPADDAGAASEYHVEFVYGGAAPLDTTTLPVPVRAWVAKGTGA